MKTRKAVAKEGGREGGREGRSISLPDVSSPLVGFSLATTGAAAMKRASKSSV